MLKVVLHDKHYTSTYVPGTLSPPPPVFVAFFFSVFCESRFVRFYGLGATVSSSVSIAEASREVT